MADLRGLAPLRLCGQSHRTHIVGAERAAKEHCRRRGHVLAGIVGPGWTAWEPRDRMETGTVHRREYTTRRRGASSAHGRPERR